MINNLASQNNKWIGSHLQGIQGILNMNLLYVEQLIQSDFLAQPIKNKFFLTSDQLECSI